MIVSPSLGKMVRPFLQSLWWWVVLAFWLIAVFPQWYTFSYTKVRELKAFAFQPWEAQLPVLYEPSIISQMLFLRDWSWAIQDVQTGHLAIVVPEEGEGSVHPLFHNRVLLRALVGSEVPIRTLRSVKPEDTLVILAAFGDDLPGLQATLELDGQRKVLPLEVQP